MNLKLELIALSAIIASTASAGTIIGNVTDSITSEPLIGVTIITKGKSYGTVTNIDGNYKLTVPDGTYDIVAHYTGYKDIIYKDTKINGAEQTIDFKMSPDNKTLTITSTAVNSSLTMALNSTNSSRYANSQKQQIECSKLFGCWLSYWLDC